MNEHPTVAIVIVNYETSAMVRRCVASIHGQDVSSDVVVVDNPSPARDVENLADLSVHIVRNSENIGYGLACNAGAAASTSRYVCILNPDTALPENSLRRWTSVFEREQSAGRRIGILAPALLTDSGSVQRSAYEFPSPINYWFYHSLLAGLLKSMRKRFRLQKAPVPRSVRTVGWVMGAAMLLPRSLWEELGGFSDKYFLYAEDMDLCFRARQMGYDVLYAPEIEVVHSLGESAPDSRDIAALRLFGSLRTFLRLRYSPVRRLAVAGCIVTDMILRLAIFVPLSLLFPGNILYAKRVAGYRGVLGLYLGLRHDTQPGAGNSTRS